METQSSKIVFYSDGNILFEYELYENHTFLHCTIQDWKPSVYKHACRVFHSFLEQAKESGVKGVYTITPNPKFCELFGGVFSNIITVEGNEYEVYKWVLK